MSKENLLFAIIGLLLGLIVGFMFANSVNQSAAVNAPPGAMQPNQNLPPGHPQVGANDPAVQAQLQAAVDRAKQEPNNFEAQIKAAEVNYEIQRFDQAVEYLKRANELKPDDYETVVNLGNANFDAGRYEEAEKWYTAALAKQPDDVNARTDLGLTFIFRASPNYDRAIQEFTRSLEKEPNHKQALQNLTVAYTKKGDAEKAKATLARLESLDATNAAIPKLREEIQKLGAK